MRKLFSWKKLVLVAVCIAMVFTFVACGEKTNVGGNVVDNPTFNQEFGQLQSDPTSALSKVAAALFTERENKNKVNLGFNGDLKLKLGNNELVDINVDLRLSVDRKDASGSKFSLVINRKGKDGVQNPKMLLGAYFDGVELKVDARGTNGHFYVVDTDIIYLVNLIASAINQTPIEDTLQDVSKYIKSLFPVLGASMVKAGAMDVYEKYVAETNSSQITSTIYLKKTIMYVNKFLSGNGDIKGDLYETIVGMVGADKINQIITTLNKVAKFVPDNATINIGLGVIGANDNYNLVNGSFKVGFSSLEAGVTAVELSMDEQADYVKKPIDPPSEEEIDRAKLGAVAFDVGLDVRITKGKVSFADIDKALGGILNGFVQGLDQDIDFSKNYIEVPESVGTALRISFAFQLDIKDNNKTNILAEIYFDSNGNEKNDDGKSLLQIYYVGKDQAFYIDLSGFGKASTLPNKLKITKDLNGNSINLTQMFSDFIQKMITESGKLDFSTVISMVADVFGKDKAPVTEEQVQKINQKMLNEYAIPTVTNEQGGTSIDVMAIVKIILKELQWDYNDNGSFYGFSVEISAKMFREIFAQMGMDISLLKGASLGIHVTPDKGLGIELDVTINAETYKANGADEDIANDFPTMNLGLEVYIDLFKAFDESRLPADRLDNNWQTLELKSKVDENGKLDILNSLLASLSGKKVYLSAAAQFDLHVDQSNGEINVGSSLNSSIGGALGAALADLQLKTGAIDVTYTLKLVANVDLGSLVNINTTEDVMTIIKKVLGGDQELSITLTANYGPYGGQKDEEILAMLLSKGALYFDAENIGIPKTKIELDSLFEAIDGLLKKPEKNDTPSTSEATASDPNATIKTVIAILSNVDVIKVMEGEIAIALNSAFLNVLIPMFVGGGSTGQAGDTTTGTIDLTMSKIELGIDFNSDIFNKDKDFESVFNKMTIYLDLATDLSGTQVNLGVRIGGINLGIVDTNVDEDLKVRKAFFQNRNEDEFTNPLENSLLNFGLTGTFRLTGDGEFTFNNKPLNGEIGELLSTLALIIGMDNLNAVINLNFAAAIDLSNFESNNTQIALTLTNASNDLIVGVYVYDKYVYVNIPGLIKPFRLEFDVVSLIYDLIQGNIKLPGKGEGENPGGAVATAEGDVTQAEVLRSLISVSTKTANVTLSSNMIKGLVSALVGSMTKGDETNPPKIDPQLGDEIISLVQTLPFDIMFIGSVSHEYDGEGADTFLDNLVVDLNIYVGEKLVEAYERGDDLSKPQNGVVGLGIKLGDIYIDYIDSNSKLDVIRAALEENRYDDLGKIESVTNFDIKNILANTKASLAFDGYLSITSNGVDIGSDQTIDNNIMIELKEIMNTLPELLINIGALQVGKADLMKLYFHLAVSADIGAILDGNYNDAIELSLGIYREKFIDYTTSDNDKLLSVVVLSGKNSGTKGVTLYVDAKGLAAEGTNNDILSGKIKLENIDLNSLFGSLGIQETASATADDFNTTMVKMNGVIGIINSALQAISISNSGLTVNLGEKLIGVIVNLITKNDGSVNAGALPLTAGDIRLVLKQYEEQGITYEPGLHAKLGFKNKDGGDTAIALGIGLYNLNIAFAKMSGAFLHEDTFDTSEYVSLQELKQVSVSLDLGLDVDMKEGVHNLNLLNKYGKFIGSLQSVLALTEEGGKIVIDQGGAAKDLHLNVLVQGQIGIADVNATEVKLLVTSHPTQKDRLDKTNGKVLVAIYLYKDEIYVQSDILNITNFKIPSLGISQYISDTIGDLLSGAGAQAAAFATASEGLDFLIGDRMAEITISKVFLSTLIKYLVPAESADLVDAIINNLFQGLKLDINLRTMSASINLDAILNEKPDSTGGLINATLAMQGLEISVFEKNFISEADKQTFANCTEAKTNAFIEFGASASIKREKITEDKQLTPDNIFGQLAGVVDNLDMLDPNIRGTINSILRSLYINIMSAKDGQGVPTDDGMYVKLNVLVQVNLDWNSWQSLDLSKSSFRLLLTDTGNNPVLDVYLIGSNDTMYIDAPLLGTNTKLALNGINLIELYEQSKNPDGGETVSELSTATAGVDMQKILGIIDGVIGKIEFADGGMSVGFAPKALVAIAGALGLVPSLDSGLVDAVGSLVETLPNTSEGSGIYIDYAKEVNNKTSPVVGLRYGLDGVGMIDINLNHYALGAVNDFASVDVTTLPFKDKDGLAKMRDFAKYDGEYSNLSKLQNIQLDIKGELKAGLESNKTNPMDLSSMVQGVLGSILSLAPLQEIGAKIYSDVKGTDVLNFRVQANLDIAHIVENLQLGLTVYKKNSTSEALIEVFYDKGSLYVNAPDYLGEKALKIANLLELFSGNGGASSTATGEGETLPSETIKQAAALNVIFGKEFVGVHVTSGIFAILVQLLQGMDINLTEDMFASLENQFDIGIEIGSTNVDEHLSLPELYASLSIKFGPVMLGLKASEPRVSIGSKESIVPQRIIDNSAHFSEVTFRVQAEGRLGISADKTILDLNALLKEFGVNETLDFGVDIANPNDPNGKPINLHLGLELDAEICLGDISKCNIALRVNAYKDEYSFSATNPSEQKKIGEVLALYMHKNSLYLDLKNNIIELTEVHINTEALTGIIDAIKGAISGEQTTAPGQSGAVSTAEATANDTAKEQLILSNLIQLNFNGVGAADGEGVFSDLGSITAEIGGVVIQKVLEMLGLNHLAGAGLAAVIKIDTPTEGNSNFGIGINVVTGDNSTLINNLGLYVWLGNIKVVKQSENTEESRKASLLPPAELVQNAFELSDLYKQFISVDITASLSMMTSTVEPPTDTDENAGDNSLIMKNLITEFFKGFVPWMPDFLAQLEIIGKENGMTYEDFMSSHAIRLQANVNLGMLINNKTCTICKKDFNSSDAIYQAKKVCPYCGASNEQIEDKGFYLDDIDLGIEILRNTKVELATVSETLLGLYIRNSQIAFYGEPFGLNNFVIERDAVESIANTIKYIIGQGTSSGASNGALSTAGESGGKTSGASVDIVGLIGKLVRQITISMYAVRVAVSENLLSYIPELMESLGVQGFPEFGYPSLNENNYIQIGLIQNEKVDLSLLLNLDMFGLNTQIAIEDVGLGLGSKKDIEMPKDFYDAENKKFIVSNLDKLDSSNSILNVNVEAELRLDINEADTNLSALLGGLLGDLKVGYKNDKTITKDFLLRINAQIDIADYSLVLGVEIIEQFVDGVTAPVTVLGIYYDSVDSTAYVKSTILPNMKITGLELDVLLGKLMGQSAAEATANGASAIRPIINPDAIKENSDSPSVKVTLAMQQYFAVAISGELISQIINGIDQINSVPVLPDFEVALRFGKSTPDSPFAITLQVGLGENNLNNEKKFLIDLTASLYIGPVKYDQENNKMSGGTYVNFLTKDEATSTDNQIITSEMREYPTLLNIAFDANGDIKPEVIAETVELGITMFLNLGHEQGNYNFSSLLAGIFGENVEFVAMVEALEKRQTNLAIDVKAQINVNNLIMNALSGVGVSLKGTNLQLTISKQEWDDKNKQYTPLEKVMQLTFKGGAGKDGNDALYLKLYGAGRKDPNDVNSTEDIAIVVDTINIMDIVNKATGQSTAISTASPTTALADFINTIIKDVHIREVESETGEKYIRADVNFAAHIFDDVIKLVTLLTSDTANATTEQIMNTIAKLNLPDVTRGGLYLAFNQSKVGLGVGLDVQLNNSVNIALGLEINALGIVKDESDLIMPEGKVSEYKSVSDLQVKLHFEGYAEMSNHNTPEPMSIGGIITTILGLLNVNVGDVDFNVETTSTEKYGLILDGYIDTNDFQLDENGKPKTANSKIKLSLTKENLVSQGENGSPKHLLDIYLDFAKKGVYIDLTGMNLPKLALTGLDLGQMLGNIISPYLGGQQGTQTIDATATADGKTVMSANKLSAMLYLTLGVDETSLRFNADLINAILQLVLGYLSDANPNNDIINTLKGMTLPDFGTVALSSFKDESGVDHLEVRIYRVAGKVDDNYLALGVKNAWWNVNPTTNGSDLAVTNTADYGTIYDLKDGLGLRQLYVDTTISLKFDFSDPDKATEASSFTRYISRMLALLIDKSTDEAAINKYQIMIVSDNEAKKVLQYELRIKGILDITDIFGGSNLSIELWKMDLIHTAPDDRNNVMLLGAYLRKDSSNGLPTLFVDLNNLGLPRIKLVGIDVLLGGLGLSSATAQSNVIGTGNYDAVAQAAKDLQNRVVIEDNQVKLEINQGFLYGILSAALPDVFKDGYINAGAMKLPLPNVAGVELLVDLSNGLQKLNLNAYLEKETSNHIGIEIRLNELDIAGGEKTFADNKIVWTEVGDKYSNVKGEDYFNTFGAVHVGTSFKADMINELVESIDPNILIQYNKRSDGYYRWPGLATGHYETMYQHAITSGKGWDFRRMGQSWNNILLSRASGNKAQAIRLAVVARSGANNKTYGGTNPIWPTQSLQNGEAMVDVYLGGDGNIYADIDKAARVTNALGGVIPIIAIPAGLKIGNMIFGAENSATYDDPNISAVALGTSGMATAAKTPNEEFSSIFANFDIGSFLKGIEIRIYTNTEKNGGYAQTEIQVKVDPVKINEIFRAVNYMLANVFDPKHQAEHWNGDGGINDANKPVMLGDTLRIFIKDGVNATLGGLIWNNTANADTDIGNLLGSLLPLPELNCNLSESDGTHLGMKPTSDQATKLEYVRSELTLTLGYNPNEVGIVGALKSINAQFGNKYGFGTHESGNNDQALEAVNRKLGWLELNIKAHGNNELLGTKAVSTVNGYNRGEDVLQRLSEQYIASGNGDPIDGGKEGITITDPVKSVEEIREIVINNANAYLPTKVNVSYLDGTSTGGAINGEEETMVSIVWDDSRIDLSPNGSKDSYLYGWVQNKMIAKIKVTVDTKYELKNIDSFEMAITSEQNAIAIEKLGSGNIVKPDGSANIKIIMESYLTKNLPSVIYVTQGEEPLPWIYSTTAVKRIVYREVIEPGIFGKEYDSETTEGLTQIYDRERGEYVNVEEVGWRGDWYISKDRKEPCQGKLEWDTSNLAWSASNPYLINTTVGDGTVGMKLITGKMDDLVLKGIKVEVERTLDDNAIIDGLNKVFGASSKDMLEIDIIDMPNFIEKFKEISNAVTGNGVTSYEGKGLEIDFDGGLRLNINPDEISFDLSNINSWISDGGNKYGGDVLILPVKITRTINNPGDIDGRETNVLNVDVKVKINMLELVEIRLKKMMLIGGQEIPETIQIALNPYGDFVSQLKKQFAPEQGVRYVIEGIFRSSDGMLDKSKHIEITEDSFDMNSTARVKFDLSSIYGTYTYKGGNSFLRVFVGDNTLGYLQSILPISVSGRILQGMTVVNIDEVNVLDANSLSNIGKALELQLKFLKVGADIESDTNNVQIVWYDKDKLMEAAKTGKKDLRIDAIIGFKQNGETKLNNYLNQRVTLLIKNVKQIYAMSLVRFAGFPINKGADGKYMLPANVNTNVGDLVYRYHDETGSHDVTIKDVTLTGDFNAKTAYYTIGLFDFAIKVDDDITRVTNFFTVDAEGNKTDVNRVFSQEADGTLVVKYSFVEKLPSKLVMELTVPTFDEKGNINGQKLVYVDVNLNGTSSLKEATVQYGVHTIKVKVTK